jgi:hypothetical protein
VTLRFGEDASPQYIVALGLTPGTQLGRQFEQRGNERYVLVPSRNVTVRLLYRPAQPGEATPSFQAEAFRSNETLPFYQRQFSGSESVEIDGDRYAFEPQRYAVIRFGQDYGLALVGLGASVALVGMALSTWRPLQRLCLVSQPGNGGVKLRFTASTVLKRGTPKWFEELVQSVAASLTLSFQSGAAQDSGESS